MPLTFPTAVFCQMSHFLCSFRVLLILIYFSHWLNWCVGNQVSGQVELTVLRGLCLWGWWLYMPVLEFLKRKQKGE